MPGTSASGIDLSAMSDMEHQDDNVFFLDVCNQTVVADTVTPFTAVVGRESLAMLARILAAFQILADPSEDQGSCVSVHLLQCLLGSWREKHMVGHARPNSFSTSSNV